MGKITREAFIYLSPSGKQPSRFAQCGTCAFVANGTCLLFRGDSKVAANDSCGLYVPTGQHNPTQPIATVTKSEAGFVKGSVRCENCAYGGSKCGLYVMLNKRLPEVFDLEEGIESHACCNAFTTSEKAYAAGGAIEGALRVARKYG